MSDFSVHIVIKTRMKLFMDSQGSVREGRQGLCRLHPCYLCGNQCQERHQHQRSVHRDKWVCFSNKRHLWPLTPLRLCNAAFKYLSTTELDCFSRSCEREIKQTRLLHSEDLTLWELRAFCHQTYFFSCSSHFIISVLLPKQPWPFEVCSLWVPKLRHVLQH